MSYYYEKTGSYLSNHAVKSTLGADVLDWSDDRKQELGLFPASNVSYSYNTYTHTLSGVTWTKYTTDSDFRVANPDAVEDTHLEFPGYVGQRSIVSLSDSAKVTTLANAKRVVFEETADRMARVAGASLALRYNALSLSDSAATLTAKMTASDSDIFSLAYELDQGNTASFPTLDQDYLAATTVVADVISGQIDTLKFLDSADVATVVDPKLPFGGSSQMTILHASWDASNGTTTPTILSSYGISGITRIDVGEYRVDFMTNMINANYTVTTGCGTTDYSGTGASPRTVSVLSRANSSVTVLCERTDDAVNEDNEYMSVMIIGNQVSS